MKKIFICVFAAIVTIVSCTKIQEMRPEESQLPEGMREFIEVSILDTKLALGNESNGEYDVIWSAGDQIAVIDGTKKSIYELYEGEGTTKARFKYVSGDANPAVIADVVYPASASKEVPVNQTYTEGSFDSKAPILAYHNETDSADDPIILKNQCSYLCFQLTGKDKINEIKVAIKDGKTYTMAVPQVQLGTSVKPFYMVIPVQENVRTDVVFTSAEGSMTRILASKTFTAGAMHRFAKLAYKADKIFSIMSYNIGMCEKSKESSPDKIAKIIQDLDVDAVVMNEVKHLITKQDEEIANALGWKSFHKNAITEMGNTILYNPAKLNGKDGGVLELKNESNDDTWNENRVCLFAEFDDFILVGSHLEQHDFVKHSSLITNEVERRYKSIDKPVFFCGDMNTRPYSSEMRSFQNNWTLLSKEDQATQHNPDQQNNLICIDYIHAWKGAPQVQVLESKICKGKSQSGIPFIDVSDHFPIYVKVKIGNSSKPFLDEENSLGEYTKIDEQW